MLEQIVQLPKLELITYLAVCLFVGIFMPVFGIGLILGYLAREKHESKVVKYVNLTNGLEAIREHALQVYHFLRIQSSWVEDGLYQRILQDIDHDLLMNLALGKFVIIYDYSASHEMSKALRVGLSFIRYCIERNWFGREIKLDKGMHIHFKKIYDGFQRKDKKKLKYYRRFLNCNEIKLHVICKRTTHDSDWDYYRNILKIK